MKIAQITKNSWRALLANKSRSFLTMLGIIIGIAAVIVIFSVGKGAESLIYSQFTSIGTNLIAVLPGASDDNGPPASVFGITITTLKNKDIDSLQRILSDQIMAASGYVRGQSSVVFGSNSIDAPFLGVSDQYVVVEDVKVKQGRFFTAAEEEGLAKVAVLGSQVAVELFNGRDPIGKKIKIGKHNFTVIGVLADRGVAGFVNQDRQVIVPLSTAQKILLGIDYLTLARLRVKDGYDLQATAEQVRQVLRELHNINDGEDDFSIRNLEQARQVLGQLTGALSLFLAAIGAIALLVGGVGIMNIMLAAVNERTYEIGLRKAVGARRRDITLQFLLESILLTLLGGVIGIVVGAIVAAIAAFIAKLNGLSWQFSLPLLSILLSVGMAFIIGVAFGYYPARKAAELNPIDALRYE